MSGQGFSWTAHTPLSYVYTSSLPCDVTHVINFTRPSSRLAFQTLQINIKKEEEKRNEATKDCTLGRDFACPFQPIQTIKPEPLIPAWMWFFDKECAKSDQVQVSLCTCAYE